MQRDNSFDGALVARETINENETSHEACVGAPGCADGACGLTYPQSFDLNYLACYFQVLPQAALAVAANTAAAITFNSVDPYFIPHAVSAVGRDSVFKGLTRSFNIGSVTIDGCRYEGVNTTTLTAASTQFWTSEKWRPEARNGCACPVCWGPFTNVANGFPLVINVFNPNPVAIDIILEVYGEGKMCLPNWCDPGDQGTWRRPRFQPQPTGSTGAVGGAGRPAPFAGNR